MRNRNRGRGLGELVALLAMLVLTGALPATAQPVGGLFVNVLPVMGGPSDGMRVHETPDDGIQIGNSPNYPNYGVYVPSPGVSVYGLWPNTAEASGQWALFTIDNVEAGNIGASAFSVLARVAGPVSLEPGDVVAAVGVGEPLAGATDFLPLVGPASEATAGVIGVVASRMVFERAPGKEEEALHSAPGPALDGDFVSLTVRGVALVKVSREAQVLPGQVLVASAEPGRARALRSAVVEGLPVNEGAPVVGVVLAPHRGEGSVAVYVNPGMGAGAVSSPAGEAQAAGDEAVVAALRAAADRESSPWAATASALGGPATEAAPAFAPEGVPPAPSAAFENLRVDLGAVNGGLYIYSATDGILPQFTLEEPTRTWRVRVLNNGSFTFTDATSGIVPFRVVGNAGANDRLVVTNEGISVTGVLRVNGAQMIVPDYVFDPGYDLETIAEHAAAMFEGRHLPAVGPARYDEEGRAVLDIGAQQVGMLEELEKAHIYIAELHGEIEGLKQQAEEIEALRLQKEALEERLARLEARLAEQD